MKPRTKGTLVFQAVGFRHFKRVPICVYEFAGRYEIYRGEVLWCINSNREAAIQEALSMSIKELEKQNA